MLRSFGKVFGLGMLLVFATAGALYYQHTFSAARKIEKLEDEKRQLEKVVERLSIENRIADILVSRQGVESDGALRTTLLFVEYDRKGEPLPAKSFTIDGDHAHIDAMVIKFDRELVAKDDPLRGRSIALFHKIFGDKQSPSQGMMVDTPGKIPDIYRDADPRVSEFEMSLWKSFWKLYEDEDYRRERGVRLEGGASGQSVWGPFKPDRLYTIKIESDGGLTMVSSPLKGVYREALKQRVATTGPV